MAQVDIVRVDNGKEWIPETHYAVEQEKTGEILFTSDTQQEAIDWAEGKAHTINIHRVRNRKASDRHGQYRAK